LLNKTKSDMLIRMNYIKKQMYPVKIIFSMFGNNNYAFVFVKPVKLNALIHRYDF
jgi:hypothetical protein